MQLAIVTNDTGKSELYLHINVQFALEKKFTKPAPVCPSSGLSLVPMQLQRVHAKPDFFSSFSVSPVTGVSEGGREG